MNVAIICVPFSNDIGRWGVARAPQAYLDRGIIDRLRAAGHTVLEPVTVSLPNSERTRDTVTNLGLIAAREAAAVKEALRQPDTVALLLEGDCTHAPGAAGGVMQAHGDCGVVWFDAHGDMHTMATTTSGLWGGMPYGVMLGWDLDDWRENAGLARPVAANAAALFGASDLDEKEIEALETHPIARLDAPALSSGNVHALVSETLAARRNAASSWYLHIDLDVAGPEAVPGGLTPAPHWPPRDKLLDAVQATAETLPVSAFSLAAVNPTGTSQEPGIDLGIEMALRVTAALAQKRG